jgi:Cu2+-exporting ATPase
MGCSLCDLPTPDPPLTAEGVEGSYCCRGCLEVARTLDDPELADLDEVRENAAPQATDVPEDAAEAFLRIDGMHCSTCEAFLEGRIGDASGVYRAEANYAADLVRVTYDAARQTEADLPSLVDGLGYTAQTTETGAVASGDRTTGRLLVGGFFGMMAMLWYLLLLYPTYLGLPEPYLLIDLEGGAGRYLLWNSWLASTVVLGYTGKPMLRGAYVSLRTRLPNMDLLVALAATTAYVYSTIILLTGGIEVYFDVTIAIILVVTVGERYEHRVKQRATGRLADLTENRVEYAARISEPNGAHQETEEIHVDELEAGDRLVVESGERVPVDGTVLDGVVACDESLLTGESRPMARTEGESVIGGATVVDGSATIEVTAGAESTANRLTRYLWDVQSSRHGVQRLADVLATIFVPLVVVLALVTTGWRLFDGDTAGAAMLTGLTVLVVSCPCALGLATPLATASGVRAALEQGVVVTDASLFERATEIDVLALDKTGTLTTGKMAVLERYGDDRALARAAAIERFAEHPVAKAVVDAAEAQTTTGEDFDVTEFEPHPGEGACATVDGDAVVVGKRSLLESQGLAVPEDMAAHDNAAREAGQVSTLVGWDGAARGVLVAGDQPRERWEATLSTLAADVSKIVVLTGDTAAAVEPFEAHPDVDAVYAGMPPEAKAATVKRLRAEGTVAMVGDGSNDAPSLAAADIGIAMADGTQLAADAAAATVVDGGLDSVSRVLRVARAARRRVRTNLAWAFTYNAVALPLAMAGLLNPLFAALAMSASSLLVVANSARSFGIDGE